jgi:uncharacterized damage-inducible protein DinB
MGRTHHLALANILYLKQGMDLLQSIPDALYVKTRPPEFPSGIGAHIRHNLDHVINFVNGWREGSVDYDLRLREKDVETSRAAALDRIQWLIRQLEKIADGDEARSLMVKMDEGGEEDETRNWSQSTVKRELQFLLSHTVHHYALIAVLLRLEGVEPVDGFGVAPSTLRFQQNTLPAAAG